MRRPPDLRVIEGGVSAQDEPKPSRGRAPGPGNPECLWATFVAAQERSKRTLGLAAGHAYSVFLRAFVEPAIRGGA